MIASIARLRRHRNARSGKPSVPFIRNPRQDDTPLMELDREDMRQNGIFETTDLIFARVEELLGRKQFGSQEHP
jgi:hypothetical protein